MSKIAILGAGVSGLTSAFYLSLLGHKVTIFESQNQIGGLVQPSTINIAPPRAKPHHIDMGAESFAMRNTQEEQILKLLSALNLEDKIQYPSQLGAHIYNKTIHKIPPTGPFGTPTQITPQILRAIHLSKLPRGASSTATKPNSESLARAQTLSEFIILHFGRPLGSKIIKYITSPILEGVYSINPNDLLWRAAAPNLEQIFSQNTNTQQTHTRAKSAGAPVATLHGGMHTLVSQLLKECTKMGTTIKTKTKTKIDLDGNLWINNTQTNKNDFDFVFCTSIDPIHDWVSSTQPQQQANTHITNTTLIVQFQSTQLNTYPIGTGCLFVKNNIFHNPPKGITHINAKWPHIQNLLPPNTHIVRISYRGSKATTQTAINTIEKIFKTKIDTQNIHTCKKVWQIPELFWNKNLASVSDNLLHKLGQFPKIKAFGHYINGSGIARAIPSAISAAHSIE